MSATRCYCLLLVLTLGDCVMLGNLFIPVLQRTTVTRSIRTTPKPTESVLMTERYWVENLKESVFKTIAPEPPFNKEIYHAIFSAPFYGGPDTSTMLGDVVTLASGDLKKDMQGTWIFCQEGCVRCSPCNENSTIQQLQWTVKRIRHRGDRNTYRYDLQFNVNPFMESHGGRQIRSRGLMGHVYSYNDPQPPSMEILNEHEVLNEKDYLLKVEDYDAQEYNDIKDGKYRKFTEIYDPGFVVKVDANRGRHVVHDVPFLTQKPPVQNALPATHLYPRGYISNHHHHHHHHGSQPYPQTTTSDSPKLYPDYYNVIYNEVLQTLLANSKLWQGLPPISNEEESCSRKDSHQHNIPIAMTGQTVISNSQPSDYGSPEEPMTEFQDTMDEQLNPSENDINMLEDNDSFNTEPRTQNSDLTVRNCSRLQAHLRRSSYMPLESGIPETTTEFIVVMVLDNGKEKTSAQKNRSTKNTRESQSAIRIQSLIKEYNNSKKLTEKITQRTKKDFMKRFSNASRHRKVQRKFNLSTTTVPPQTSTVLPIREEVYLEDTELPSLDFSKNMNNSSEIGEVTDSLGNNTTENSTEPDDFGPTDSSNTDPFEDEFARVTNMNIKNMIHSDAWKELKIYKQLLKQLALSVISQAKIFDDIPTSMDTTITENSTPVSTTTGQIKHKISKQHRNSYHHREEPQKGLLGTW